MKKCLIIFLFLASLAFATDVSTILELYLIGTDPGTLGGSYTLINDIDLDYTDGYIGNTNGDGGATGDPVYTWIDENKAYVFGDIVQYTPDATAYYYYCSAAHSEVLGAGPLPTDTDYWQPIGQVAMGWRGFGYNGVGFTGTFDGQGHTITNLYQLNPRGGNFTSTYIYNSGLIGYIHDSTSPVIKNTTLTNVVISDNDAQVGGFISTVRDSSAVIKNCRVDTGSVTLTNNTKNTCGGFVGALISGTGTAHLTNCSARGMTVTIQVDGTTAGNAGGFAGNMNRYATNCYAENCTVVGKESGGFAGKSNGATITNCYVVNITADPMCSGSVYVGGFVANTLTSAPSITNCYAVGKIGGAGTKYGFIGNDGASTVITSCYYDSDLDGVDSGGVGTPKTTAQMKDWNTFVGWDFTQTWNIDMSYPYFKTSPGGQRQRSRSLFNDNRRIRGY